MLASEERRAGDRGEGVTAGDVGDRPSEAAQAGYRRSSAERDVEQVLLDPLSMEKLLRALTCRIRNPSEQDTVARWIVERRRHLVADLLRVVDESRPARVVRPPRPAAGPAPQEAVTIVLSSPRATREVLDALAERAHDRTLLDARHDGTVKAARRLLQALFDSRTLRRR